MSLIEPGSNVTTVFRPATTCSTVKKSLFIVEEEDNDAKEDNGDEDDNDNEDDVTNEDDNGEMRMKLTMR